MSISLYLKPLICMMSQLLPVFDDVAGHYNWINFAKQNELQQIFPADCVESSKHCV